MPLAPDEKPSKHKPEDTPRFEQVIGLWLQDDGYEVIPIDAGETSWRAFQHVADVWRWMEHGRDALGESMSAPEVVA